MLEVTGEGVQIGIPIKGDMGDEIFYSFLSLKKPKGSKLTKVTYMATDVARNRIVDSLEKEWLFFMDADQTFHPESLERLLSWNLPIVSGLYFSSAGKPVPHCYKYAFRGARGRHTYIAKTKEVYAYLIKHKANFEDNPVALLPAIKEDLIECDGVGAGCLLIQRKVFEAIKPPYFQFKNYTGEDFYFCRKVKKAGFKIFLDPGILCGHKHRELIGYRHFLSWITTPDENFEFPYPWG